MLLPCSMLPTVSHLTCNKTASLQWFTGQGLSSDLLLISSPVLLSLNSWCPRQTHLPVISHQDRHKLALGLYLLLPLCLALSFIPSSVSFIPSSVPITLLARLSRLKLCSAMNVSRLGSQGECTSSEIPPSAEQFAVSETLYLKLRPAGTPWKSSG